MISLWQSSARLPAFSPLKGDAKTDVLIIGGGLAGILCAYFLQTAGVDYRLVEAERICSGITQNTTAKITSQHGLLYHKLIRNFGLEKARLYLAANEQAVERYRSLCQQIDCGFSQKDNYVYTIDNRRKLEREVEALDRLGFHADLAAELPLPFPVAGAVRFPRQGQFNPLQFVQALSSGLHIHAHTKVLELGRGWARTSYGTIRAEKMIIATHFPILNKHGGYFMKLYQHRSYVIALEGGPDLAGMYVDDGSKGLSLRNQNQFLLIGGGGHRTGKKGGGWETLRAFKRLYYPAAQECFHWAAQDCMSLDGAPYIGRYSTATPDLFVATGFNKWGITSSMVAAMILCDLVQGRDNPYAETFRPSRTSLRPQLVLNGLEAAVNLLTPTRPRCPHMGCALKWNPVERTWDCPCHGSRFDGDGTLLDNPATDGLGD